DLYFYYVANESHTYPVFGVDRRVLLFSIQSSSQPPEFDDEHIFLYYSEVTGEYYTLVKADILDRQRQLMPSDEVLTNAFKPATITVGH
ncbi:MAG: hypothetical protein IJB44_03590, partial [Clostridia bacterium]|nr:hypothetical protein [Clostridia bacterium]